MSSRTELLEEAQVIGEVQANIVDAGLHHVDPLDAKAAREPTELLGIVATVTQDVGVDHPTAAQLEPAGVLTDTAAFAHAYVTGYVELCARLREREVARTEPHTCPLAVNPLRKGIQGPFEVAHRNIAADRQEFELGELSLMACRDLLIAVAFARQQDPHRFGGKPAHHMNLARRGVRSQHNPILIRVRANIERILHIARRMVGREVQELIVVEVALDFPAFPDAEAHLAEDALDLTQRLCHRMKTSRYHRPTRKRYVNPILTQLALTLSAPNVVFTGGISRF